jgi:hypothetical protein
MYQAYEGTILRITGNVVMTVAHNKTFPCVKQGVVSKLLHLPTMLFHVRGSSNCIPNVPTSNSLETELVHNIPQRRALILVMYKWATCEAVWGA